MKKMIVFCLAVVLVVAMAAPAWAVTPTFKAPELPKIPEVKTNVQVTVTVTEGFWARWFREHPVVILVK